MATLAVLHIRACNLVSYILFTKFAFFLSSTSRSQWIQLPEVFVSTSSAADYFVTKCSVLIMSLFVFFTTTMSVSFTLRETQSRMLKFTGIFSY